VSPTRCADGRADGAATTYRPAVSPLLPVAGTAELSEDQRLVERLRGRPRTERLVLLIT
jgi:hypothetical protein